MKDIFHFVMALYMLWAMPLMVNSDSKCTGFKKCCSGYFWNETIQGCTKCSVGYYAKDCKFKCPYPSYGDECQRMCVCSEAFCDFVYGCVGLEGTTTFPESTTLFFIDTTIFTVSTTPTTLISSKNLTHGIAERSSFLYKWLFFGTAVLCLFLGTCVIVLLIKLVLKKRSNTDIKIYQHTFQNTTDEIRHVYEAYETDLNRTMGNTDDTLNSFSGRIHRNNENIYLSVIDNAGTYHNVQSQ